MMHFKKLFVICCLVILTSLFTLSAHAGPGGGPVPGGGTGGTGGAGAGGCNWDQFLERLGRQETGFVCPGGGPCDRQYTTCSPRPDDPSCGKWQFTPSTWDDFVRTTYPQCAGMSRAIARECWPVQRWATERMMEEAVRHFEANNWCGKLGRPITGTHQGTTLSCTINQSGLLSAYHNARGNACAFADGTSSWTSQINWRICDAGNIPFPLNCNPPNNPPTVSPNVQPNNNPYLPPAGQLFPRMNHIEYLIETMRNLWVASLQQMTTQLSTTMMQQVVAIGMFFDAKHQMETQRLLQMKYAEAHKDYQPSVQMCEIGTLSRDLSNTKRRSELTHVTMAQHMLARMLASGDAKTIEGGGSDIRSRLEDYITNYCSIDDNNRNNRLLCRNTGGAIDLLNMDIDFTRLIDTPLTLNVNFATPPAGQPAPDLAAETQTEKNLFVFLDYIFMHDAFPFMPEANTTLASFVVPYQEARSLMAMRSVAQNSFAHLIAIKSAGPKTAGENIAPYLKSLMREMGISPIDIIPLVGQNPSYYAQMEVLTKMAQDPGFIMDLQGKPANVRRVRAAMAAIKLMQDRDINEALMRREMLISMILELKLREKQSDLQIDINNTVGRYSQP